MMDFISKYRNVILCAALLGVPAGAIIGYAILVPDSNLQAVVIAILVTSIFTNIAWWLWRSKKK